MSYLPPARLLTLIQDYDPATAGADESLGAIAACEQVIRYLGARQVHFTAAAARASHPETLLRGAVTGSEATAAELAAMLALTRNQAQQRVNTAEELLSDSPKLLALVEAGKLDLYRASTIDSLLRETLTPGTWEWDSAQDTMSDAAPGQTSTRLRTTTRRTIETIDPAAARRHTTARKSRQVVAYPRPDGMGALSATLSAETTQLIDAALDALADDCRDHTRKQGHPDPRTHQQRRADAFAAIFTAISHGTPLPIIPTTNPTPAPETGTGNGPSERPDNKQSGNETSNHDTSSDDTTGNDTTGNDTTGNDTTGNDTTGGTQQDDEPTGEVSDEERSNDEPSDHETSDHEWSTNEQFDDEPCDDETPDGAAASDEANKSTDDTRDMVDPAADLARFGGSLLPRPHPQDTPARPLHPV
jgi:hypothetical protein